ncbi:MAG: hypothetical protein H6Q15_754 [Bacteroidetes bacterium]|nr:hypothetical protein [Bacteroidota bacterium]
MKLNNKFRIKAVYLITFLLLLYFSSCKGYYREQDRKKNISGIITNKYIDEFGHYTKVITINGYENIVLTPWIKGSTIDTGNIWEFIEVGDSVNKAEGSLKMKVIKPSGKYQVFDYYDGE